MTIFQDKLLTRTYCDEAGDYAVPNVLSQRDLVFRPDLRTKNCTHTEPNGHSSGWVGHYKSVKIIQYVCADFMD